MTATSYRFVVSGRVQGVGFRDATRRRAERLGVCGWVMNRPDGAVEGLACGTSDSLTRFRIWLSDGPPLARVMELSWEAAPTTPPPNFVVRR
jgi:acylphosphatase